MYTKILFSIICFAFWAGLGIAITAAYAGEQTFTPRQLSQFEQCMTIAWETNDTPAVECEILVRIVTQEKES